MVREIMRDVFFLAQKSEPATDADLQVARDLLDTLEAHADECVGMAANMIGVKKRIIAVNMGLVNAPMLKPVILKKSCFCEKYFTTPLLLGLQFDFL